MPTNDNERQRSVKDDRPRPNIKDLESSFWELRHFTVGRLLGEGAFGQVYEAKERMSGVTCALKVLSKKKFQSDQKREAIYREIEIHMNLNHANILRFYGYFYDTDSIYLILEHADGGNLYRLLQNEKEKRFSELQAARYVMELAAALQYIHRKYVIHRDIKLENILVGNDGKIKLADFGWSIRTVDRRNTVCGTLDYMPPEMMKPGSDENSYSEKIDSWSLGVLIYEFLVGKPPFEDSDILTQRRIANCEMTVPEHVSPEAKDLIERLLVLDPEKRLSPTEVLEHAWIALQQSGN